MLCLYYLKDHIRETFITCELCTDCITNFTFFDIMASPVCLLH